MLSSMTGVGRGVAKTGDYIVESEVKSLNSRYLDVSFRLPKDIAINEFELRDVIKKRITRGKVSVNVQIEFTESSANTKFDEEKLNSTVKLLQNIKEKAGIENQLTLTDLLSMQHLFLIDSGVTTEVDISVIINSVENALEELISMRKKEGAELEKDLTQRLESIQKETDEIIKLNRSSVEENFGKFKTRAKQLIKDIGEYDDRLKMELAVLVEKYDVTEECVRLKSHLKMFSDAISTGEAVGRKLNFIVQEMNREANTINSKAVSSEILHKGIHIKEEVEKIREQIQNIE